MKINLMIKSVLFLITLALFGGCLKNDMLNLKFESHVPTDIDDGLTISDPATENINSAELTKIYQEVYNDNNLWSLRSLLVFRNGKLVAESYLKDEQDITNRHLIWSSTKQVMGVLVGLALENGTIEDIDDPISKYFTDELIYHEDKKNITIRNLLTMQSGIDYNNDGINGETDKILRQIPDNSVKFILDLPNNAEQGTVFKYNDGNPHIVSAIIQKRVSKPTDEWAKEVLFSKIELTNFNWVRYKDGITLGAFGIETSPRELAKIALCVADSGKWKGNQVVSANWIKDMTTPHVTSDYLNFSFGYYWWVDENRGITFMDGHGGQYAFIVPHKNLVVVMTAFPNTQDDYQIKADEALSIVDKIIKASN